MGHSRAVANVIANGSPRVFIRLSHVGAGLLQGRPAGRATCECGLQPSGWSLSQMALGHSTTSP